MALTRKSLKAMGLTEEQVESVIEMHTETVDGLRAQVTTYKADAEKLPGVQKELDDLKKIGGEGWKEKYDAEKAAHEKTKNDYAAKETAAKVREAYRAVLREAGVADKYMDTVIKATDFSGMKLDKDGQLDGRAELVSGAKTTWSDFVSVKKNNGAKVDTPPDNGGKVLTREDIYKKDDRGRYVMDTKARQEALQNLLNAQTE